MVFNNEFSVGDIIDFITLITVIVGAIVSLVQYDKSTKLKRADYINELTERIRTDKDISPCVYDIEYDEEWYDEDFHGSGELERKFDKTLSYFSYICYLKKQEILTNDEFKFFQYEIDRIVTNSQVIDYFYNLYHFARQYEDPITFQYLFEYAETKCCFDEAFYDKESHQKNDKYHQYINI